MQDQKFKYLQLDGGCAVLDFINTVNTRTATVTTDYLESYEDLLAWAGIARLLPAKRLKELSRYASEKAAGKEPAYKKVKEARDILYRFFKPLTENKIPGKAATDAFNTLLGDSFGKIKLSISTKGTATSFAGDNLSLDEPLREIMKSAYDLLTREDLSRLKACPGCGWLFLDTTKNGRRRWCDMQVCGSNDKASRYYYRKKLLA